MEKSLFIQLFGDYPMIRVLNHLLIFREFDYSLSDIARESGVAWSTLNLLWPKLEKNKIVKHTRNVGKAKMYKLDMQNEVVKQLTDFTDNIIWNKTIKEEKIKVKTS